MMSAVRWTLVLAGLLGGLVAVDAALLAVGPAEVAELPSLDPVDLSTVRRVVVTKADQVVTLERLGDSGNWKITSPIEGPADSAAVRDLVARLRRGVPMQVRLEEGNVETYGLKSGSAIRLQIYEDERDDAVVDIYVGGDTVGGASFVRFPDDDTVYRAQVGGRHRLDRAPRDWRDPSIVDLEAGAASALTIAIREQEPLTLRRSEDGGWTVPSQPDFDVDVDTVKEILTRIGGLRAGRVLPPDFPLDGEPTLRVTVERPGLDPVTLSFFIEGELAYVRRTGRDEVFQVASSVPGRLALPLAAWRNRKLVEVDRVDIARMTFHDARNGDYVLEQNAADSSWKMVKPPNVDVNLRDAQQAAIRLASLSAAGIAEIPPADAGFPAPNWIELELRDGRKIRIELGIRVAQSQEPMIFVRTLDEPDRIGVMRIGELLEIRKGWSR